MTHRHFCFTINNWTDEQIELLRQIKCRYIIWGKEVAPTTGTPHLQGYLEYHNAGRYTPLVKIFGKDIWFEGRKGTREQARDYCMKCQDFEEHGDFNAGGQGRRNDLRVIIDAIKKPDRNIKDIMENHAETYSRNMKFCEKYQALCERDETREFRKVETDLFIGDAGTGKSRKAREIAPDAFTVNPEDTFPFDGYDGEKTIIIDDFEGQLKYKHLLKILDGHQLRVNVKGGHRYAKWNHIIITTNEQPDKWYQRGLTPALARRLTTVTTFCHEEAGNREEPCLFSI